MTRHLVAVLGRGIVGDDEPVIHPDDLGFSRGDGCFDSARVVRDDDAARVVGLEDHLERLEHSARRLEIEPPPREAWQALVAESLAAWDVPGEATLKLVLTRGREWFPGEGPLALLTISQRPPVAARATGPGAGVQRALRVVTLSTGRPSDAFEQAPWLLGGVKTLSYVVNVAAAREARRRGADDAIFVTTDGFALDGPTSGLVVAHAGVLRSAPTGATGILASLTVEAVMTGAPAQGLQARWELVAVEELATADGVWLVSSSRGPCPVVELDGRPLRVDQQLTARVARAAGF